MTGWARQAPRTTPTLRYLIAATVPASSISIGLSFTLSALGHGTLESFLIAIAVYLPLYWMFGAWRKVQND